VAVVPPDPVAWRKSGYPLWGLNILENAFDFALTTVDGGCVGLDHTKYNLRDRHRFVTVPGNLSADRCDPSSFARIGGTLALLTTRRRALPQASIRGWLALGVFITRTCLSSPPAAKVSVLHLIFPGSRAVCRWLPRKRFEARAADV